MPLATQEGKGHWHGTGYYCLCCEGEHLLTYFYILDNWTNLVYDLVYVCHGGMLVCTYSMVSDCCLGVVGNVNW